MNRSMRFVLVMVLCMICSSGVALDRGSRAPDFSLRDLNGRNVRLADLRGKVVVLDFWASWCEPCKQALPELDRIYKRLRPRGLVVIGVNIDREVANARRFLDARRVSFSVVHDGAQVAAHRYNPPAMPSTYIIDKRGVVRHVHGGYRAGDTAKIEKEIEGLLGP